MEVNRKNKSMFGNLCNQFEGFFQDVDSFVNKGTVKYVESQGHNVGASVKKLYYGVQDAKELDISSAAKKTNVIELPQTDHFQEKINDLPSEEDDVTTWNDADYGFEDYLTPETTNTNTEKKNSETCVDDNTFMSPMGARAISISNSEASVFRKERFDDVDTCCDSFPINDACRDILNTPQSKEFLLSYSSCDDDEEKEMGFVYSTSSASPKTSGIVEFISENFTYNVENMCNDHIVSNGHTHTCNSSTSSCTTTLEAMDMHSNGSSSVVFDVDAMDREMETVDLSSNVIHDKNNFFSNCKLTYPVSRKSKDFKYYKKLIKDAIVSRKRLSKEYEHLGILYGDIDMESKHNFELSTLPSCPESVNEERTRYLDVAECDWELL